MADRRVDFLLIGGGVAAASCARTLREEGARGSILVVGREQDPPYERPPLSKGYLAGKSSREDALFLPPGWWESNDVELLTRVSAMKLDTESRVAKLSNKQEVEFDQALIATGANVRRLRVDGSDLDGIHYLRAFGNADAIREDATGAGRVVLIGGSYIGCELAATLTSLGIACSILMQEEVTLERVLGAEVGGWVQRQLEERGVEVHGSDELERFEGEGERVTKVVSKNGVEIECGCVAIGAGVAPDVMLARSAGLELGERGGVACSARLETSVSGIYAAGDVAEHESALHDGTALVEHWEVAVAHGRTAALNMLGREQNHDEVPYFWSDLADWATLEYVGVGPGEAVVRGSLESGSFSAFYLDGERVVGALAVGRPEDLDHARRLIRERATPGRQALVDEGLDLAAL
ncbi:MAG: 3-phenylpropionate/trans-cinnamate dioxygenase ferredoxin reductase component [Thermoleophilaceae bacterium]|nr:3-phenylpropionate/trans-cinnamate dioxygenase ferredoxin reductase component [Thermoleophilaceae bacterium]